MASLPLQPLQMNNAALATPPPAKGSLRLRHGRSANAAAPSTPSTPAPDCDSALKQKQSSRPPNANETADSSATDAELLLLQRRGVDREVRPRLHAKRGHLAGNSWTKSQFQCGRAPAFAIPAPSAAQLFVFA